MNQTIRLVRSEELSQMTGISAFTIRKMARENRIPSYRPTRRFYLFDPVEVIETLKKKYRS